MKNATAIRVLCVVPRGLSGRGGIETLFSHVDTDLRSHPDHGIEIDFVSSRGDASGAAWIFHFPPALIRYAWRLATGRYDIVHLNAATNASAWRKWLMQNLARLAGAATVVHFHGSAFPGPGDRRPAWVALLRKVLDRADAIIVLGDHWRSFIADFYGMSPERFTVVANGVADFAPDAPQPRNDGAPVRLLFAGNLTDAKGARVLLQSLALLPADLPPWHATFAGTGDVAAFRAEARSLSLDSSVEFTGWVARETILPLYRRADVVVLPSRNEVLPVCLLEGACAGAALIATPVGSVPDVLKAGENGLFVDPDDPEGLARALAKVIGDGELRQGFRAASREVYEARFDLDTMIASLRSVYQKALARRG